MTRGYSSLETVCYLAALKLKPPDRIYVIRRDHEQRQVSQLYGICEEGVNVYAHAGL